MNADIFEIINQDISGNLSLLLTFKNI